MPGLADDLRADEGAFLPMLNHLRAAHASEGAKCSQEINGFENVGLALGIAAHEDMEAGREIHIEPRVIAEIAKAQMGDVHALPVMAFRREGKFCVRKCRWGKEGVA